MDMAIITSNGLQGCIDTKGNIVIEPRFDAMCSFSKNGAAKVDPARSCFFIDRAGRTVLKPRFKRFMPLR